MQDTDLMLHTLLELGESMLADGADVRRVEQTLSRMGKAYGAVRMDVFVITSSIVLTMCFADGSAATQTRRIEKSAMTDFGKLEAINAISRSYCEHPFPVPELYDRLQLAKRCEPARWKLFAGSCLAAGALAVFFGGTALDGLAAGLFALVLCVLQIVLPPLCKNKVLFNFLSAFAVGGLICLACRLVPALHSDKVIIGDIMLLIPGLAFTNAFKDIFIGDTISGVMRLIETVLWAAALALGFALWENISYVLMYGLSTALVRAVTAVPGHACFGVFMGVWYGLAKRLHGQGRDGASKLCRVLALLLPALLHGCYDFIASIESVHYGWLFAAFVAILFVLAFILVRRQARHDRYINNYDAEYL